MATYYEMLKIQPTASAAEIETAIQGQHDRWRRLVDHHDPSVANQANLALATLETIRVILTDPLRRAAYDAGIGLGGMAGGLADWSALMESPGPVTTAPALGFQRSTGTRTRPAAGASLWKCPRLECGADNPPHTRYCLKCGGELVRECPECGALTSLVATQMCGTCGYSYDVATQRRDLKARSSALEGQIQHLQSQLEEVKGRSFQGFGCSLLGIARLLGLLWGVSGFRGSLYGWTIGIICLGCLLWQRKKVESLKARESHNINQAIETRRQELKLSEQCYERLALNKTGR